MYLRYTSCANLGLDRRLEAKLEFHRKTKILNALISVEDRRMSFRPFRNIGQFVLAACAVSALTVSLHAQTAPSGPNPSRIDIFAGYSYFGAHGSVQPAGIKYSSVDEGAIGSGAYYFNKYIGGEIIGISNPDGQNDGLHAGYAGPIFRLPMQNYTLFTHALAGGVRIGGPNSEAPATLEHEPYRWGTGLMVGGGMDYDLPFFNHRFGLRLFEADYRYTHASFGPYTSVPTGGVLGGRTNLSGAELSTGLLVHFGHIIPPPPVTYACAVTAPTGTVYPGDAITITGTPTNLLPKKDATYTWTSDAGPVSGTSSVASIDTKSLAPGSYTVKGHVSQGTKPGQFADCSVPFTVTAFQPPSVSCSANPTSVKSGDPIAITATGSSPQNRPLTYSYSATSGSISGNTGSATLSTTGVPPGTSITVTCNVVDDKGQTASNTVSVSTLPEIKPVVIPQPVPLCTTTGITFPGSKHSTRVNNDAKGCLDDITDKAKSDPTAKIAITGNSEPVKVVGKPTPKKEEKATAETLKLAAQRAVDVKEYLVVDKGLDASRILVYTGTAGTNSTSEMLIPVGATMDMTGLTPVDETVVKPIVRKPLGEKKHKK
jgi:outer membrane protein OmpA-like peptidoglycan-associated protein